MTQPRGLPLDPGSTRDATLPALRSQGNTLESVAGEFVAQHKQLEMRCRRCECEKRPTICGSGLERTRAAAERKCPLHCFKSGLLCMPHGDSCTLAFRKFKC